jgi:hypothetical protein
LKTGNVKWKNLGSLFMTPLPSTNITTFQNTGNPLFAAHSPMLQWLGLHGSELQNDYQIMKE